MAQHGYLREYDEDFGGSDDRERWRGDDRERGWSERDQEWRGGQRGQHDRNFMFGDRDRDDRERGFLDRASDRARSFFRDDDDQYRRSHEDEWGDQNRSRGQFGREQGFGGWRRDQGRSGRSDWERSPRNFGGQHDHYLSWRDRQMDALDRDYADYCREREQQFHQDFDSWRSNRQTQGSTGRQQAQGGSAPEQVMELNNPTALSTESQSAPSPVADATLGTNNPENSGTGRGRR